MASSETDSLTWRATGNGRWERDIDEAEQFYTSLAKAYEGTGRTFFAMTGFISFSVSIENPDSEIETYKKVEEALQKAWIRLRYDHPTIASRVEYDPKAKKCKKIYETFTGLSSQQDWLDTTFCVIPSRLSGLDWCNSDPLVPRLPTLFLIKSHSTESPGRVCADLVLRAHHDIIDGIGTLILINNLFAHAAQAYDQQSEYVLPRFNNECANLSPPLRVAAAIPPRLQPEQEGQLLDVDSFNNSLKSDVEIASLPFNKEEKLPKKHQRVAIEISEERTGRLMDACRGAKLSVTHAYHTAISVALRDVQECRTNERKVRYISYSLINERDNCQIPYSTSAHAASVYHSVSGRCLAVDLTVPASSSASVATYLNEETRRKEFIDIARTVRGFYLDIRDDKEHIFRVPSYWAMSTITYPADGATPPIPACNDSPSVSISSMGIVDRIIHPEHGAFQLENPWVTGEELGAGLGLFLGTWKGRLTLSAAYNDAWHQKDEVLRFLERCNQATFQALGVY